MFEADEPPVLARFATILASLSTEESLTIRLCEASRRMLDAEGAAATLSYKDAERLTIHVTDELAAKLDDLQDVLREGPGFDAVHTRDVVVASFGDRAEPRWPLLEERLAELAFGGVVTAIPLHADESIVGVLTLYTRQRDARTDLSTARFLGGTLGAALLQYPHSGVPDSAAGELWGSRAQVHQATGMVVAQVGVRAEDALALLRGQAFSRNMSLIDVAREIIERRINFRDFTIEGD
jgi:hypothetical protein